jgi:hypothetical protein
VSSCAGTKRIVIASPPIPQTCTGRCLRAYVEKKKRKAREKAAWEASMAEVGRFEYLSVTADNDIRLKEHGQPAKEWTEEEIWEFITLGGAAVDPRRVKGLVRVRLPADHVPDVTPPRLGEGRFHTRLCSR